MNPTRFAYGALHRFGAGAAPSDLESVDCLLLDGGPVRAPDEPGPDAALAEAFARLGPGLYLNPELRVVAGLAGSDPRPAAESVAEALCEAGSHDVPLGVVLGGNLLDRVEELLTVSDLAHAATGARLADLRDPLVAGVALLSHEPVTAALGRGARIVLVGGAAVSDLAAGVAAWAGDAVRTPGLLTAASRAGEVLAQVAGEATRRSDLADADLACAARVVAEVTPDGDVAFVGSDETSPAAQRAHDLFYGAGGGMVGGARENRRAAPVQPGQTRAVFVYREGFAVGAVLECAGAGAAETLDEAAGLLREGLAAEGLGSAEVECSRWRPVSGDSPAVGLLTIWDERRATAEAALRRVRRLLAAWAEGPTLRVEFDPRVVPRYKTWPTSLPSELAEWSVDIRAASDWVD